MGGYFDPNRMPSGGDIIMTPYGPMKAPQPTGALNMSGFAPNMPPVMQPSPGGYGGGYMDMLRSNMDQQDTQQVPKPFPHPGRPSGLLDALATVLGGLTVDTGNYKTQGLASGLVGAGRLFSAVRMQDMQRRADVQNALNEQAHDANVAAKDATDARKERDNEIFKSNLGVQADNQRLLFKNANQPPAAPTASEPTETIVGPNGKPVIVKRSEAYGKTPYIKPDTPQAGIAEFDPVAVHRAMKRGDIPTDPSGYTRGQWGMIASAAAKDGDTAFKNRQIDWIGTRTYWGTRNRQQQVNILQNLERVGPSLDLVGSIADDFYRRAPQFGIKKFNSANVTAAANGVYGPEAKALAAKLIAQINDTRFELQQVYGNGYSPTDQALKLASENLGKEWDNATLHGLIDLGKQNVEIRRNSVINTAPATPDNPAGEVQQAAPLFPSGAPSPSVTKPPASQAKPGMIYMQSPDGSQKGWVPANQKNQAISNGWKAVQ